MDCGFNLAESKQPNKVERDLVLPAIVSRFGLEVTFYCLCDMGMKAVSRYIQLTSISIFMKAYMMPSQLRMDGLEMVGHKRCTPQLLNG